MQRVLCGKDQFMAWIFLKVLRQALLCDIIRLHKSVTQFTHEHVEILCVGHTMPFRSSPSSAGVLDRNVR